MLIVVDGLGRQVSVNAIREAVPFLMRYIKDSIKGYHSTEDRINMMHDLMHQVRVYSNGEVYTVNNSLTLKKVA